MLGTVESPDGRQLVVADVPGLIEGASEGVGLGHEFLAHLERARTLVHVIDAVADADEQWRTIDAELGAYGAGLDERPQIVVLNKIDLAARPAFAVDDERMRGGRSRSRARRARGSTSSGAPSSRSCPAATGGGSGTSVKRPPAERVEFLAGSTGQVEDGHYPRVVDCESGIGAEVDLVQDDDLRAFVEAAPYARARHGSSATARRVGSCASIT